MPALRPCLECGALSRGSRCARHTIPGWSARPSRHARDPRVSACPRQTRHVLSRSRMRRRTAGLGLFPVHHVRAVSKGGDHSDGNMGRGARVVPQAPPPRGVRVVRWWLVTAVVWAAIVVIDGLGAEEATRRRGRRAPARPAAAAARGEGSGPSSRPRTRIRARCAGFRPAERRGGRARSRECGRLRAGSRGCSGSRARAR